MSCTNRKSDICLPNPSPRTVSSSGSHPLTRASFASSAFPLDVETDDVTVRSGPSEPLLKATPRWQTLGLMLLLGFGYVWHSPGPNEQTRLNLVYAIVFHGKLSVDEYKDNTIDMAFHSGHYYCDKAPGLSFMATPVMWALKPVWARVHPTRPMRFFLTVYLPRLLALAVPSAMFGALLYLFLRWAGVSDGYSVVLVLAYGLGTLVLPYSAMLYGHQMGAGLGFSAFMLLVVSRERPNAVGRCALAGFMCGYAVVVEYPMAAIGVILAVYLMATRRNARELCAFVAAGLIGVSCLLVYNYACFGSPWSLGYSFEKTEHFQRHLSRGVFGIALPDLKRLYDGTISPHRGIFTLSPFLLLSVFGWPRMVRDPRWRAEAWVSLAVLAVFLLFISSLWEESFAPGERHLIPVLPFLVLPLAFCPTRLRPWVVALGLLSILHWSIVNFVEPRIPETFSLPFVQHFLPSFFGGKLDYNWGTVMKLGPGWQPVVFCAAQAGLTALLILGMRDDA